MVGSGQIRWRARAGKLPKSAMSLTPSVLPLLAYIKT